MSAKDKLGQLTAEGKALVTMNCKVSPEMRTMVYDLKERTGRQVSMIVQDALDEYFEGYEVADPAEVEAALSLVEDDELTDEDLE